MNLPARTSGPPLAFAGMLGLLLAVEAGVARHDATWRQQGNAPMYGFVAEASTREAPSCDVLSFGDSQVKFGFAAGLFTERTGRKAFNLAIPGGQPATSYFALRHALAAGARPSAVLVDCKPNILSGDYRYNDLTLPELLTTADSIELAAAGRDASLMGRLVVGRNLLTFRRRAAIRASLAAAFRGEQVDALASQAPVVRNWAVNRGALLLGRNPANTGRYDPAEKRVYLPDDWEPDRVSLLYLRRFADLAAAHKIPVYWLLMPIAPEVQALRERAGLDERFDRLVRRVQGHCPNLIILDARHSGFPAVAFTDRSHLDARGAAALTMSLAEALSAAGPASAWRKLPSYRPVTVELEDVEQSRLAVQSSAGSRR